MEDFADGNGDRRVVGIRLHDVSHVGPPLLRDFVGTHVLARLLAFYFLIAEQDVRVAVPVDAVVAHTSLLDLAFQFGPQSSVTALVFFLTAGLEEHLESKTFHAAMLGI